jgi:cytochrome c biogenesis protein CcmG/thiol:disulfide interchange protein DsbE
LSRAGLPASSIKVKMPRRKCASLLAMGLLWLAIGQAALAKDHAPEFVLPTNSGKIDLAEFKGKVVYLDFWASWCPPCRKSFPWLNEMQQRYGRQGFAVVAINLDKTRDLAGRFLQKIPANFTVAYDPLGKVADSYQVRGMPSSFIIDRNGQIRETHIGFREKDALHLEETLQALLVH